MRFFPCRANKTPNRLIQKKENYLFIPQNYRYKSFLYPPKPDLGKTFKTSLHRLQQKTHTHIGPCSGGGVVPFDSQPVSNTIISGSPRRSKTDWHGGGLPKQGKASCDTTEKEGKDGTQHGTQSERVSASKVLYTILSIDSPAAEDDDSLYVGRYIICHAIRTTTCGTWPISWPRFFRRNLASLDLREGIPCPSGFREMWPTFPSD